MTSSVSDKKGLTEKQLLKASESKYMNEEQLAFFRNRLIELHESTNVRIEEARHQIANSPEFNDESDRASWEVECSIALRILDREQKLLPKIMQALERIRLDTYGYCLESGEPIGIERLLARPTAEYCADVKAVKEVREHFYNE